MATFYLIVEGFNIWTCRFSRSFKAGVAAGWTRVSEGFGSRLFERRRGRRNSGRFSGELLQSRWISTTFGFALIWATARLIRFPPICCGLVLEELALPGASYLAAVFGDGNHILHISVV